MFVETVLSAYMHACTQTPPPPPPSPPHTVTVTHTHTHTHTANRYPACLQQNIRLVELYSRSSQGFKRT